MTVRAKVWSIGLALAVVLVGSVARDAASRELGIPAALLVLALCALVAEGSVLLSMAGRQARPTPPEGARPADGIVEVVPIAGVEVEANPATPRFRRFARLIEDRSVGSSAANLTAITPALLGRVVLISVFVGRDGRAWTDSEIARSHEALERAGLWIEREARRRDAPVNIGLADTYFRVDDPSIDPVEVAFEPEGDDFGPMEAHAATKALVGASRAAGRLGFVDVVDLLGRINPRIDSDARVWLFHLRQSGRSLAIPAAESDVSGVGLVVCFSREASFPEPLVGAGRVDPTTVAHELLHLFGASDKYGVSLGSFAPGSVTSRDIMRLDHDSLYRMTIDPLTASEIGWKGSPGPQGPTKNARR
jgi:hypothetical protein